MAIQIGDVFGRLTVSFLFTDEKKIRRAECVCSCGGNKNPQLSALRTGATRSCGCLQKEEAAAKRVRHGAMHRGKRWPEYNVWNAMRGRCSNPKSKSYSNYGGRGIRVCERWNDFGLFIEDMGRRPSPELTIERKNNDGNYEPGNCVWASREVQRRNRRPMPNERAIRMNGEQLSFYQFAKKHQMTYKAAFYRATHGLIPDAEVVEIGPRISKRK
jgi:hypothetical protein